jgi:hypothetical protein
MNFASVPAPASAVRIGTVNPVASPTVAVSESGISDCMSMLYLSMAKLGNAESTLSENRAKQAKITKDLAFKEYQAQLAKAQEDANKGSFFDHIGKSQGLLGTIGMTVMTVNPVVGAALVGIDFALHETGLASHMDAEDNVTVAAAVSSYSAGGAALALGALAAEGLRKSDTVRDGMHSLGMGDVIDTVRADHVHVNDEDVRPAMKYIMAADLMIYSVAASVVTLGAAAPSTFATVGAILSMAAVATSTAATVAQDTKVLESVTDKGTASDWVHGLQIASLAFGVASCGVGIAGAVSGGASAATAAGSAASRANTAANTINAGASAVKAADEMQNAAIQHDVDNDRIAAETASQRMAKQQRLLDTIIDTLKESKTSHQHALETLKGVMDTMNQTMNNVSTMRV